MKREVPPRVGNNLPLCPAVPKTLDEPRNAASGFSPETRAVRKGLTKMWSAPVKRKPNCEFENDKAFTGIRTGHDIEKTVPCRVLSGRAGRCVNDGQLDRVEMPVRDGVSVGPMYWPTSPLRASEQVRMQLR